MAISTNLLLKNVKGQIAKTLVVKQYGDRTVLSAYPDMSDVVYNEHQKLVQSRFSKAVEYAQSILRDPVRKAEYIATLPPGKRAYNAAIKEYMNKTK